MWNVSYPPHLLLRTSHLCRTQSLVNDSSDVRRVGSSCCFPPSARRWRKQRRVCGWSRTDVTCARELRDGDANLGGRHHRFADLVVGTVVNSIYNRCLSSVASDQSITRFRYVVCERARTIERSGMNSELSLDLVLAARDTDWRHRLATPATDPSSNYLTGN